MLVSFFPSAFDPRGEQRDMPWGEAVEYLTSIQARTSKDGELYSFAAYGDPVKRANNNVQSVSAVVIDFDECNRAPSDVLKKLTGIECAYHSTFSNEAWVKKWRLIIPLDRPAKPDEWPHTWEAVYNLLDQDKAIDISCKAMSRAYYSPSCPLDKKSIAFSGRQAGQPFAIPSKPTKLVEVKEYKAIPDDQLDSALGSIDSNDYDTWIRVGMALKKELGGAGFDYFDKWSATSAKYEGSEKTRRKYDSFKRDGVTVGTLYHYALEAGWIPQSNNEPYEFKVRVNFDKQPPSPPIAQAPNLVGQVQEHILKSALYPQPRLALAASIALVGTLMAHKVQGTTKLRTNMYCMALAPSGSGKEHQRQANISMLEACKMERHAIGVPASAAGLLYALRDAHGRALLQIDEIGHFLAGASDKKASTYLKQVPSYMTQLFSTANSTFYGTQYSQRSEKVDRVDIDQPCLSILGTTVPNRFYESLTGDDVIDGFLSRWLFFGQDEFILEANEDADDSIGEDLLHELNYWANAETNIDKQGDLDDSIKPRTVGKTKEAEDMARAFRLECRKKVMDNQNDLPYCAVWNRAAEHAEKLALVGHANWVISAEVMQWAIGVAKQSCNAVLGACMEHISSSEREGQVKKVISWIARQRSWVTRSDITRATQHLKKAERNEILSDIVESRLVEFEERAEPGKKTVQYFRKIQ
jgi:hypothetical protein